MGKTLSMVAMLYAVSWFLQKKRQDLVRVILGIASAELGLYWEGER